MDITNLSNIPLTVWLETGRSHAMPGQTLRGVTPVASWYLMRLNSKNWKFDHGRSKGHTEQLDASFAELPDNIETDASGEEIASGEDETEEEAKTLTIDDLRAEYEEVYGRKPDKRWSMATIKSELGMSE